MDGIHFSEMIKLQLLKICKHASFKNRTVLDLSLMDSSKFELYFAF
jgi:hypothetical protein